MSWEPWLRVDVVDSGARLEMAPPDSEPTALKDGPGEDSSQEAPQEASQGREHTA